MTFEKALEAMKQGKSVIYKGSECHYILSVFDDCIVGIDNDYRIEDAAFRSSCLLSDNWEIYEEPLKEPEMTAEHAIEILKSARRSYRYIPGIDGAIDFAIEAIEKQNQVEAADDLNNDNESVNVERAQKKYDLDKISALQENFEFIKAENEFYAKRIELLCGILDSIKKLVDGKGRQE